jgi:hypothetical protein
MRNRVLKLVWSTALIILVVGSAALFYPFETGEVPSWRLQIVDPHGKPISGIGVREYWGNDSVDYRDSVQDSMTDDKGFVTFPVRTVTATLLRRVFYPLQNLSGGAHSSWGPFREMMRVGTR